MFFNFMENEVTIKMNAPSQVVAGTEFTVEITIHKSKVEDFSRFQQELPIGLFAKLKDQAGLAGGDFRFSDQKVKILWYKGGLPPSDEFTISYIIQVDPTVQGTIMLGGQFAYLLDNNRQTAEILPQAIEITAGDLANVDTTKIKKYSQDDFNKSQPTSSDVTCFRKKPYKNDKGEIMVDILVDKGGNNKYGKIQEAIPQGYTAVPAEDRTDVIFTFKENNVKFLWLTLPSQPKFVISYKLKPIGDQNLDSLNIKGTFSYVSNSITIPIDIVQKDELDLTNVKKTPDIVADAGKSDPINKTGTDPKTKTKTDTKTKTKSGTDTKKNDDDDVITDPETGVKYKVQIGAYRRNLSVSYFTTKMQVNEKVRKELHNGLNKYIVGSHGEYKDARDHRIKIWDNTPIDDAFVTAYNNGNRITVQEALMISNQKWPGL